MSSRGQHYRQAERLLEQAQEATSGPMMDELLTEAKIHAQLASVSTSVYQEYLDLGYTEALRDEVVATPPPDSRDWLKDDDPE